MFFVTTEKFVFGELILFRGRFSLRLAESGKAW